MKKIIRLAIIREQGEKPCPFGLSIPDACLIAGKLTDDMVPLPDEMKTDKKITDEDKRSIIAANNRVLTLSREPPVKCKFLNQLFKAEENAVEAKVECSFGDTAAGIGTGNFNSTQTLNQYLGISFMTLPFSYYNMDVSNSAGYNNGLNSYYMASKEDDDLTKIAEEDKNRK